MEATPEQSAEGVAIVQVLASVLDRLVKANSLLAEQDANVTKFHALKAPNISVFQYLERIHKYASCSSECFILALIYVDRLIQRNNFLLTHLNVHRVVISAVLVAAKFFDDAYYNNAYYAKVGGVLVSELNSLEVEFLFRINFCLHVTPDLYRKYHDELLSHATGCEAMIEVASALQSASANLVSTVAVGETNAVCHYAAGQNAQHQAPVYHQNTEQRIISPSPPITSPAHDYYGYNPQNVTRFQQQQNHAYDQHNTPIKPGVVSNLSRQLQHHVNAACVQQQYAYSSQFTETSQLVVYPPRTESTNVPPPGVELSDQLYDGQSQVQLRQQQVVQGYNTSQVYPMYVSAPQSVQNIPHTNTIRATHTGGYPALNSASGRLSSNSVSAYMSQSSSCSPHQAHVSTHFVVTTTGGGLS